MQRYLVAFVLLSSHFATAAAPGDARPWNQIRHFVYQLQNADLDAIGKTEFDLVVIDYSRDGSAAARYPASQIEALKHSPGGAKRVLAYLSIGEAEDYRFYWRESWRTAPPAWLGPVDPDWPGNYKVKYWDPDWQKIVLAYLDKLIDAGFDGAYLDVIDAYYFWGPEGESGLKRAASEAEMVDFVKALAHHARDIRGKKDFAIFVQNAEELGAHADYMAAVTGIGREDLFYNGNKSQRAAEIKDSIDQLRKFKAAGKCVLVIDYPTEKAKVDDVYLRAGKEGFVPYTPRRALDKLTIPAGHEPD